MFIGMPFILIFTAILCCVILFLRIIIFTCSRLRTHDNRLAISFCIMGGVPNIFLCMFILSK